MGCLVCICSAQNVVSGLEKWGTLLVGRCVHHVSWGTVTVLGSVIEFVRVCCPQLSCSAGDLTS